MASSFISRRNRENHDSVVQMSSPEPRGQESDYVEWHATVLYWVSSWAEAHYAALCCYDKAGGWNQWSTARQTCPSPSLWANNTMSLGDHSSCERLHTVGMFSKLYTQISPIFLSKAHQLSFHWFILNLGDQIRNKSTGFLVWTSLCWRLDGPFGLTMNTKTHRCDAWQKWTVSLSVREGDVMMQIFVYKGSEA